MVFGEWLGDNAFRPRKTLEQRRINCHHNYTEKVEIAGEHVWPTRKGLIDASTGTHGLIPGSMGAESYVVRGKGNEARPPKWSWPPARPSRLRRHRHPTR
ncbi:RtcB family protein [Gordonia sp. B21]|uniref:RtcB family protein n=1 Tax=Gordonia sp. B21 TaxID=3151852 RepID=UPI003262FE74